MAGLFLAGAGVANAAHFRFHTMTGQGTMCMRQIVFGILLGLALVGCSGEDIGPDAAQIEDLVDDGMAPGSMQEVELVFAFPAADGAKKLCKRLKAEFFTPVLEADDEGEGMLCRARRKMVPEAKVLGDYRRRFGAWAKSFGGEYQGWSIVAAE